MKSVFSCSRFAALLGISTLLMLLQATQTIGATTGGAAAGGSSALGAFEKVKVALKVPGKYRSGVFAQTRYLYLPPGFKVSVFAALLAKPRMLAVGPDGFLYVTLPETGEVAVLPDKNRDGVADNAYVFASGLNKPHGLAFQCNDLIVAEADRLTLLRDEDGDMKADIRKVIVDSIPRGGGHWTRSVVIGPTGKLYVSAGSSCNACEEKEQGRAAITRYSNNGNGAKVYATGLRNSVGMAFHPENGELWAVDNGRDHLGDDLPPEELNKIIDGGDYGWPYCFGDRTPDPELGSQWRCKNTIPPVVKMQAHSAPLGIAFGKGLKFPEQFRDSLFVAFHGSWNRTVPTGYKLVAVRFKDGKPDSLFMDFATGWLEGNGGYWGRPVAPVVGSDGALYLSDDHAGAIYRISAE